MVACLQWLKNPSHAKEFLQSDNFGNLESALVKIVLESDDLRADESIGLLILRKPVILSYIIRSEGDPPPPRGVRHEKNTNIFGFKNTIFFGSKTPYFLYFRIKNSIFSLACGAPSRTELALESSVKLMRHRRLM